MFGQFRPPNNNKQNFFVVSSVHDLFQFRRSEA